MSSTDSCWMPTCCAAVRDRGGAPVARGADAVDRGPHPRGCWLFLATVGRGGRWMPSCRATPRLWWARLVRPRARRVVGGKGVTTAEALARGRECYVLGRFEEADQVVVASGAYPLTGPPTMPAHALRWRRASSHPS